MTKEVLLVILPQKIHKHKDQLMNLATSPTKKWLIDNKMPVCIGVCILSIIMTIVFVNWCHNYMLSEPVVNDKENEAISAS